MLLFEGCTVLRHMPGVCSELPGEKRDAAAAAVRELQQSLKARCGEADGAGGLKRSPSMTKRKRSGPARSASAKSIKAEPMT